MESKTLLVEAIRASPELPATLRDHITEASAIEEHEFDPSYVEFLDEQIRLDARGPEWTKRLRQRRAALSPFCNVTLLRCSIQVDGRQFHVEVHPESRAVIHWEEYELHMDA